MLRKKVKQNEKVKFIEINCNSISENTLTEIVKLTVSSFFVSIYGVCKKSELNDAIISSGQQFVTSITSNEEYKIVLKTDINFFNEIVRLLSETEIVVIYIPFDTITFEQFIYNCVSAAEYLFKECNTTTDQKRAIMKEVCYLTCTWVTEDNRLLFHFDNFQGAEMFEKIKGLSSILGGITGARQKSETKKKSEIH